ncbi:hypothetical protein Tco_0952259 [Tanacetum coccineum]|uniref:Reverse transcriptase domain-containing protein n=1 Tax=Tanacetum coccineum TaxID=301880 RepID=A0ABQ5E2G4_9ASTR
MYFRERYYMIPLHNIPSEDPYEEAARQLLEQAPRSPEYVPDPMELEDHVPVYIPEPEHLRIIVQLRNEAPTPLLPPSFLTPPVRAEIEAADDLAVQYIMRTQALEAGARLAAVVSAALAARDATRNGTDSHSSGTGVRGSERVARECTYQDFMKCKPLYFKGTEGVVELTQWFERMETVFRISNCSVENQVKFSTCTLLAMLLDWWKSHFMTVTHDVAYYNDLVRSKEED